MFLYIIEEVRGYSPSSLYSIRSKATAVIRSVVMATFDYVSASLERRLLFSRSPFAAVSTWKYAERCLSHLPHPHRRRCRTSGGERVPSRATEHRVTIDSEIGVYELSVSSYCWFAKEDIFEGRFFFVEN